jgi:hypothetical protein
MTDHLGVFSIRAARRYRWRLAGGRLIVDGGSVQFMPNRLERRRADTSWKCTAEDVTAVQVLGRIWLAVETASGAETFRVLGAAAAASKLEEVLHPGYGNGSL